MEYSFRSLHLQNIKKGIKFSYEYTLLNSESLIIFNFLKEINNKNIIDNFIITLLTDKKFSHILSLINKVEMVDNIQIQIYEKYFIASGPQNFFKEGTLPRKNSTRKFYAIKGYSKKSGQYLFTYLLDWKIQNLLLSQIDLAKIDQNNGIVLNKTHSHLMSNSYFYLKFNFNKFTYKFELIDPYDYLFDDTNYFKAKSFPGHL
ncbi:MAG: hypothetical protein IPG79_05385 [Saprospiraceae bacterium]|nr:hypothetical protein [Saprospiraceae bacterium]